MSKKETPLGFAINSGKGFHITFDNGVTVSVQFGGGNYCENYHVNIGSERSIHYFTCPDAEVAMWKRDSTWITKEFFHSDDDVIGHIKPAHLLVALVWAAEYKDENQT